MHRRIRALLFAFAVAAASAAIHAAVPDSPGAVEHALKRLTFGPRPGDVGRVSEMGLARWIDRQLEPQTIDDAALAARLPARPTRPTQFDSQMEARRWGRDSVRVLAEAKVIRALYSERQLEELLVDFWFNHFNVFAGKGRTGMFVEEYEREAIRPHVLGNFRNLLGATAKSPAMLFYLDNWLSADPAAGERRQPSVPTPVPQGRRRGLNENYARELLELHTLGVDGGYTQEDIVDVARAFTGWTIVPERQIAGPAAQGRADDKQQLANNTGISRALRADLAQQARRAAPPQQRRRPAGAVEEGHFRFAPAVHDRGEKVVLGQRIPAGRGIEDGEQVLDIVATHPSTARHIAFKLAQRFVSDTPPEPLVTRAAATFRDTKGDLRAVVRTIVTSDEFFADAARDAKVKNPLEFLVSAVRASGRELTDVRPVLRGLQELGMTPYMSQPPTGYPDTADAWISAGALVSRMNIARRLAPARADEIGGPEFQRR